MNRRRFLSRLAMVALAEPLAAQTLTPGKVARIGILSLRKPGVANPFNDALMQGLREFGYVEGRNLAIEYPDAAGREDRFPELAADLVRSNVDLILVIGPAPLPAALKATKSIPLVMVASSSDPVAEGIAVSLGRPGGNVTGLAYAEPDRFKKQLELLKTATSRMTRVGVLWDFDLEVYRRFWAKPLTEAGRVLGLNVVQDPVLVTNPQELPEAFTELTRRRADAIVVASGGSLLPARDRVAELAIQHGLPAIGAFREFPQAGLLMSYGPDLAEINRRAASYVDRILKGAKPGDLPIDLPSKHELVINLKTANSLRLTIPQALILRANEVIR